MAGNQGEQRIGVFICHCGGNISDHVDVEAVRRGVEGEPGVKVARTNLFSCSEAAQKEMVELMEREGLNGVVIASCSPKLHRNTFSAMVRRGGLNPYRYTHVNIREQCSWAHTRNREAATEKALRLVKAGIERVRRSRPLEPMRSPVEPAALVIGGGIAGMRAALALADMGAQVHLVEREAALGGLLRKRGPLFPTDIDGRGLVADLTARLSLHPRVRLHLGSRVVSKEGSVGDFRVEIEGTDGGREELHVGAVVVATGARPYSPGPGELGFGAQGVLTLPRLIEHLDSSDSASLMVEGREVSTMAFIYCVGSRQPSGGGGAHTYCSRFCCSAALHTANRIHARHPRVKQLHLYRDIRSYGKYEELYRLALERGSVFIRFSPKEPPVVEPLESGGARVRVRDLLTNRAVLEMEVDLVCLVTGLEPDSPEEVAGLFKLPLGKEGFFNEIHPKLRPVETVVDGCFLAGCAQGPKNAAESSASGLAAAAKAGSLLMRGWVEIPPYVAEVLEERCDGCGLCVDSCPYTALSLEERPGGGKVAVVKEALCKGEGACVPVCPRMALQVKGYEHQTMEAMIEGLLRE